MLVTATVDCMLRHLRKERERRLWLEAICIDQLFNDEKSEQVGHMGDVFAFARKVRLWLGDATEEEDVELAFGFLRSVVCVKRHFKPYETDSMDETWWENNKRGVFALDKLLSRPWFRRRWVLQEYTLAQALVVHCGPYVMSGEWFKSAIKTLQQSDSRVKAWLSSTAFNALVLFGGLRSDSKEMLRLLARCSDSQCCDERDRLFALNGLVENKCRVNYSEHWVHTYTSYVLSSDLTNHGNCGCI